MSFIRVDVIALFRRETISSPSSVRRQKSRSVYALWADEIFIRLWCRRPAYRRPDWNLEEPLHTNVSGMFTAINSRLRMNVFTYLSTFYVLTYGRAATVLRPSVVFLSVTLCIVAIKRCVLDQNLLLTAYRK